MTEPAAPVPAPAPPSLGAIEHLHDGAAAAASAQVSRRSSATGTSAYHSASEGRASDEPAADARQLDQLDTTSLDPPKSELISPITPSTINRSTTHRFSKPIQRIPYRHRPLVPGENDTSEREGTSLAPTREYDEEEGEVDDPTRQPWLRQADRASEWSSLFYDLVVVAVLSVFSSSHEIQTPAAIPIFFSYYVILVWIWTSQLHYDARYEAEDTFHRALKSLQLMVFVFIGAASGGWSPGKILPVEEGAAPAERVEHQRATDSFVTVGIAYAISRGLLLFQYRYVISAGARWKRKVPGARLTSISLGISIILVVVATSLSSSSASIARVKIALFYLGIAVEMATVWFQVVWGVSGPTASDEYVAERYGALSLIILGEGFLSLTRAFGSALSTLVSEANFAFYLQVFLIIFVIFCIWTFLFFHFRKTDTISSRRSAVWEMVHFPLHFAILLLQAAMINFVTIHSFSVAIQRTIGYFDTAVLALSNGTELTGAVFDDISLHLDSLNMIPNFETTYEDLSAIAREENPVRDAYVLGAQYFGQIILAVCKTTGVEVSGPPLTSLEHLVGLNTSSPHNETIREHAGELLHDAIKEIANDAAAGMLWIFPAAGAVLVLCALRSWLRYHFQGPSHYVVHGIQLVFGLALALLGLLCIGNKDMYALFGDGKSVESVNPLYRLVWKNWAVAVVALVYMSVLLGTKVSSHLKAQLTPQAILMIMFWEEDKEQRKRDRAEAGADVDYNAPTMPGALGWVQHGIQWLRREVRIWFAM
ncbi:uncharacterized protein LOC62_02G003475 [Vanrija pseudolonga]|uniref:Low temperature requirement A n=1 Tax=Vanrija pseudolonga TaxID=143232 RepID=A0AAF0Y4K4_9TREE|nr:hypothetical protein LOC62_02G003475 [Vanrija pseudolonga]